MNDPTDESIPCGGTAEEGLLADTQKETPKGDLLTTKRKKPYCHIRCVYLRECMRVTDGGFNDETYCT